MIGISERFALLNRLITRDVNNNTNAPTFSLYSKDEITTYLSNPYQYEKQLRRAVTYIYGASSHFRRLIQYFAGLSDLSFVVSPYRIDPASANIKSINRNYRKVLNAMSAMNVRTQFPKILTVCLREDVFYGTMWVTNDNITIQQLPSDYCTISTIEGNVPNVTFDFSYFDARSALLETKTTLENYAMLVMTLGTDDEGNWTLDYNKAKEFWRNLDAVLPEEVGSILSPMPINKISFEKSNTGDTDTISEAEQNLFTAAGVSSLLFNNDKASANALLLSIKADQTITYGIVKSIEDAVNRYVQAQSYGKNFKVTFLDCSPYNRKELGDQYLKACQYGLPFVSMYAASQGLSQSEMDCMNFLENDVLGLIDRFRPLQSSTQTSTSSSGGKGATDEGGAPVKDVGDLTDSGEQSREDGDDW